MSKGFIWAQCWVHSETEKINYLVIFKLFFIGPMELIVTLKNGSLKNTFKTQYQREIEIDGVYNLGPDLTNSNGKPYW